MNGVIRITTVLIICMQAMSTINTNCVFSPNTYITGLQNATNFTCLITPTADDYLSNRTDIYFQFSFDGIPAMGDSSTIQSILINGTNRTATYANVSGNLGVIIGGGLILQSGQPFKITGPATLPSVNTKIDIYFLAFTSTKNYYMTRSSATVMADPTITLSCAAGGPLSFSLNFASLIGKNSGLKIMLPNSLQFVASSASSCKSLAFIAGVTSINAGFTCESSGSTLYLYNFIGKAFNSPDKIVFSVTSEGFGCLQVSNNELFNVTVFNQHAGKIVYGETMISLINVTVTRPLPNACTQSSNSDCSKCTGSGAGETCLSCVSSLFYINTSTLCTRCINSCDTCSSETQCLSCVDATYLNGTVCGPTCATGYYGSNSTKTCVKCQSICSACSSASVCSDCIARYFLNNTICMPCPKGCTGCFLSGVNVICGGCDNGYSFSNNSCLLNCPENQYYNTSLAQCTKCADACLICADETATKCAKCSSGYFLSGTSCNKCSDNCVQCINNANYCTQCNEPIYTMNNGTCICSATYCKQFCPILDTGCKICNGNYYYNPFTSSCTVCDLAETHLLDKRMTQITFTIDTGKLTYYWNTTTLISMDAYSGYGSNKNSICFMSVPNNGTIPIGKYSITGVKCAYNGRSSSRVLVLTPLNRFSYAASYDSLFTQLYIYPEVEHSSSYSYYYNSGKNGIVVADNTRYNLSVGDIITVTYTESSKISQCSVYPPPPLGTSISIVVSNSAKKNVLSITLSDMAITSLANILFSGTLYRNGKYLEVCGDASLSGKVITCNTDNKYQIGMTEGFYNFSISAKYIFNSSRQGLPLELNYTNLYIYLDSSIGNDPSVINSQNTSTTNSTSLLTSIQNIQRVVDTSPNNSSLTSNYLLAKAQYEKASGSLATIAKNSGSKDPQTVISIANIICSNGVNTLNEKTLSNVILSLSYVCGSSKLKTVDAQLLSKTLSSAITALMKIRSSKTRKLDSEEKSDAILIKSLELIKEAFMSIAKNTEDIDSQPISINVDNMEGFYYSSHLSTLNIGDYDISVDAIDSIVLSIVYSDELSQLFPKPDGSKMDGRIVSITLSDDNPTITKKITKQNASESSTCGHYDKSGNAFNRNSCKTKIAGKSKIECSCTNATEMYAITSDQSLSTMNYWLVILIVLGVLLAGAVTIVVFIRNKGTSEAKMTVTVSANVSLSEAPITSDQK